MELSFHAFCVYRNPRLNFSKVARTPVALAVSWLKFEPRVSNFPVKESGLPVSFTTATGKVQSSFSVMIVTFLNFLYVLDVDINSSHDFSNVATAQAVLLQRVSLLKFEPKVSNFPVTESGKPVSVTTATGKVLARVYVMFVSFV